MESKLIKRNIISSVISQIATIICGLIVPRAILLAFGSEVNGLLSSISQLLNYVTLLEGGVGGVIAASLYKPLAHKDTEKINAVLNASKNFFFKLGIIFAIYSICIGIIYPIINDLNFSFEYVFALSLILASSLIIQYCFAISYSILLKADRKVYVYYYVHTVVVILNTIITIVSIKFFNDILIVKFFNILISLLCPIYFSYYVHKHYKLDNNVEADKLAISQRWDGFGHTLAYFIHSNTDIVILTIFSSLSIISVYSVYLLAISALRNLMYAISSSVIPSIGNLYGKGDIENVRNSYYQYEYTFSIITLIIFSCCIGLIVPFVSLYTKGIHDVNYIQPLFACLVTLAEMAYCLRDPSTSMIFAAGHFKQTAKYAYAEATLNIVVSLCLVTRFGLVGVAIGTLLAMILRWFLNIIYLNKNIIYISIKNTFKNIAIFSLDIIILIIIYRLFIPYTMNNYFEWIKYGILVFFITVLIVFFSNFILNKDKFISFLELCLNVIKVSNKK